MEINREASAAVDEHPARDGKFFFPAGKKQRQACKKSRGWYNSFDIIDNNFLLESCFARTVFPS
jgi:hypothetical protein